MYFWWGKRVSYGVKKNGNFFVGLALRLARDSLIILLHLVLFDGK